MGQLTSIFGALGLDADHIHTESFGTLSAIAPGVVGGLRVRLGVPDGPPGEEPPVTFARSGLTVRWAERYGTILELAEACRGAGSVVVSDRGLHTCETGLVSGDVDYSPEPIDAPAAGNVLVCCARPRDDLVVDL
jgi:hypothetical protein